MHPVKDHHEARIKKLDEDCMETFDNDYVQDNRFAQLCGWLRGDFPGGDFRFLDIGGGNGQFADRLLDEFPHAAGTVLDNSKLLLERNVSRPAKTLICAGVEELSARFQAKTFDVIFFNFSLHHFILDSYSETREMQRRTLRASMPLLRQRGRISILENMCDGYVQGFPGYLAFTLTSSKRLAPLVRRFGANTAGTGVCFLDRRDWAKEIEHAGLRVLHFEAESYPGSISPMKKLVLGMRDWRVGQFWLEPA